MSTLKDVKDLVQEAIDKGATTVEEVHRIIASRPLDLLEQLAPSLETTAKELKEFQQKTIGNVYDMIRTLNQTVGEVAEDLLSRIEGPEEKGSE